MSGIASDSNTATKSKVNYPRVFTASIIVIAVLAAIYFGAFGIASLFALITIFGGFELSNILDEQPSGISKYIHIILAALPIIYVSTLGLSPVIYPILVGLSCLIMVGLISNMWSKGLDYAKMKYPFTLLYWGLPFGLATHYLYNSEGKGAIAFFGIILLLWTSDTMAYFTGKALGKNKLFPSVSPGKTIEGSLGGGLFSVFVGLGFGYFTGDSLLKWVAIALVVWIVGTLGDLVESRLKRVQNVKDSGSILPGHGGFLDRFDSLVMVLPFLLALDYFF